MPKKATVITEDVPEAPITSEQFASPEERLPNFVQAAPQTISQPRVKRLALHRAYAGAKSYEEVIYPGMYTADDPRLHQLAEYLVTQGYGIWLD